MPAPIDTSRRDHAVDKSAPRAAGRGGASAAEEPEALVEYMIREAHQHNYVPLTDHLSDECVFICSGPAVFHSARDLTQWLEEARLPLVCVDDARFSTIPSVSPDEATVMGMYTVLPQPSSDRCAPERQRLTVTMRRAGGAWRAYVVHVSNCWQSTDTSQDLPLNVSEQTYRYVQTILNASRGMGGAPERVAVPSGGSTVYVDAQALMYAEAHSKASLLHMTDGVVEVRQLLAGVGELLPPSFVRISRKHIVNPAYVVHVGSAGVVMPGDAVLPVPKRRMAQVRAALAGREDTAVAS